MLTGTRAFTDGKRVLIDVQNSVLLEMLKSNEYTKSSIKQAVFAATGRQYGLGPYRAPVKKVQTDPLESLIGALPPDESFTIR
ncbi:MAG: hypothetical protein RR320_07830, partial [Oscillospiraceae bacterium]